ncbi:hypothetical protein B0H34DRAFT_676532 [Crassisporium funariophilum]|nr:hypothetical protein B0H34DRAFT_676532 [Crassisporium funariophilum]
MVYGVLQSQEILSMLLGNDGAEVWLVLGIRKSKVGFVPDNNPYTFGFLDPSYVICGSHIIPAFAAGKTSELLLAQETVARPKDLFEDWLNFYVDIFVDRDMLFCYLGCGIGHIDPVPISDDALDEVDTEALPEDDGDVEIMDGSIPVADDHSEDESDDEEDEGNEDGLDGGHEDEDDDDVDGYNEDKDDVGYDGL